MPPLPLLPNMPAGMTDINWGAMNPTTYGAVDPADAVKQAARRSQLESDREYELEVEKLKQKAQEIAISKGEAAAQKWYYEQTVKLSKAKLAEEQRQFNVTSSGYLDNGAPTLAREQFQDNSLQGWTKMAVDLGSRPEDWVKYQRMTSGVANNLQSIPGLAWTTGGQVGNQTFQGEPRSNSLANVLTAMNIGSGGTWAQQAANQAQQGAGFAMTPDQQSIYQTANEFAKNPAGAAPGWWEGLDTDMKDLLKGAAEAQGHSWASVTSRYNRSRWGGGGSASAA